MENKKDSQLLEKLWKAISFLHPLILGCCIIQLSLIALMPGRETAAVYFSFFIICVLIIISIAVDYLVSNAYLSQKNVKSSSVFFHNILLFGILLGASYFAWISNSCYQYALTHPSTGSLLGFGIIFLITLPITILLLSGLIMSHKRLKKEALKSSTP